MMDDIFNHLRNKLEAKTERVGGLGDCVLWKGGVGSNGYGFIRVSWPEEGSKVERVHRVALMVEMRLTRSQFPGANLEVSHLCHEKLCVNPMHLSLEPHATNQERIHCMQQGVCSGAHHPHPRCIF